MDDDPHAGGRAGNVSFWLRRIPFIVIVALLAAVAWHYHERNSRPIAAGGGESFTNFIPLDCVTYLETDDRWKNEEIGGTGEKLGNAGCAICTLAMAFDHFGLRYTPKELNEKMKTVGGYTARGWLVWGAITGVASNKVVVDVLSMPTHADIDAALTNHFPIAVKLFINGNIPHWVLVVGKQGTNYLMRDPLGDGYSLEPLSKYNSDIFGVRIIRSKLD